MRADPGRGKGHEHKAGKGVERLDAHTPDTAQGQDTAGRLAAAEKEVGIHRRRSYKLLGDAVGRDRYPVTLKPDSWKS